MQQHGLRAGTLDCRITRSWTEAMTDSHLNNADYLADRHRLRRKLGFWRVAAFLAVVVAVVFGGWRLAGGGIPSSYSEHIARFDISGVIRGDRASLKVLDQIGKSKARAVILTINSPGGTVTGSEILYHEIRRLAGKKPVVAVVTDMAASGGYIAALGADRIFTRRNSIVGSIGVLYQIPNFAKLLESWGIDVVTVKSAPLKAAPNPVEPTSEKAREALKVLVVDSYDWFKKLVQERRKLGDDQLEKISDGRVFTGRLALGEKLIDEIGGQREAVAWLVREKKLPKSLKVRDWKKSSSITGVGGVRIASAVAEWAGLRSLARALRSSEETIELQSLDGLLAVWHGEFIR